MSNYTLRSYQEADVQKSLSKSGILNANPPGVGKTLETLAALDRLPRGSILVICPKMATGVWAAEGEQWVDYDYFRYTGEYSADIRASIREDYDRNPTRMFIINIQMLKEVLAWRDTWNYVVADEVHLLGLLKQKNASFKIMCKLKCNRLFLLSGTPARKGPQDLWTLLHLLDPKRFRNYWAYVNRYCTVIDNGFGKEILDRPKNPIEFHAMLDAYMIRHKKEEILKDLPPKLRITHPLELNEEQKVSYQELVEEMITELGSELIVTQSVLTNILRLRQLLVCPKLLGGKTNGTAIDTLAEYLVPEEFNNDRSVVIGTVFRQAIPFIAEALTRAIPEIKIFYIHGQIKETAQEVAKKFQECPTKAKVLIYTVQSGASWTATAASTGFMLGYDWSVTNNEQAEDRIHRIGQEEIVYWKYLLYTGTVDEEVKAKLNNKSSNIAWTLTGDEMVKKLREQRDKNLNKCP